MVTSQRSSVCLRSNSPPSKSLSTHELFSHKLAAFGQVYCLSPHPKMNYTVVMFCSWNNKQNNNLALNNSFSKIAVFQPNSRSSCIGKISPNSTSLTVTKALSLHLLSAIDLECPSLYGDFSLSPVLNAHLSASLSSSVYRCLSHSPSLVLSSCILTKSASFHPA